VSSPFGRTAAVDISAATALDGEDEDPAATFSLPRLPSPSVLLGSLLPVRREELRLDVDGLYPQQIVSGTQFSGLTQVVHWIANLTARGTDHWVGSIWFREGSTTTFCFTTVDVRVTRAALASGQSAVVTFSGGGMPIAPRCTSTGRRTFIRSSSNSTPARGAPPTRASAQR
jgi:hypothetical protein